MAEAPAIKVSFTWQWEDGTPMTEGEQERASQMVGQQVMGVFEQSDFAWRHVAPMLSALQEKGATEEKLTELVSLAVKVWATPSTLDARGNHRGSRRPRSD